MFPPKKYFDAAAAVPLDDRVRETMIREMEVWGNENSKHACGFQSRKSIDDSLAKIAEILNVSADQIFPMYSGTDANRRFIVACVRRFGIENLFASAVEHSSILDEILEKNRFDPSGDFSDIPKFAQMIALMQANSETGRIFPAEKLREKFPRSLILRDFSQGFPKGVLPDFANCDAGVFAPQKFHGPKAVGLIFLKNPENFPEISKDSHTKNAFLIAGMARAFEIWRDEISSIKKNLVRWQKTIEDFLTQKFAPDELKIHEKSAPRTPGITSVAFRGVRGSELMTILSMQEQICVSTGSACASDWMSPTTTIKFIEKNPDFQFPIRISLHKFLDDAAVAEFCEILEFHARERLDKKN